jgi:8-oxo-dGTP diphosphatase
VETEGRSRALLIRHGAAGDRDRWTGDDRLRPLTRRGWRQAHALVEQLREYPVTRVLSSPYVRCVQTVEALAEARGLSVERTEDLAEGAGHGPLRQLLRVAGDCALCTHGDVLQDLLEWLDNHGVALDGGMAKGSTWVLEAVHGEVITARYLPPPA